jgi:hypothetical protein
MAGTLGPGSQHVSHYFMAGTLGLMMVYGWNTGFLAVYDYDNGTQPGLMV